MGTDDRCTSIASSLTALAFFLGLALFSSFAKILISLCTFSIVRVAFHLATLDSQSLHFFFDIFAFKQRPFLIMIS